jgi:DNA-binding response OmpR family regulator
MDREHVLLVEDEPDIVTVLTDLLNTAGYDVTTTDSVFGAAALVRKVDPCVVLLDLGLPYRPGTSLLAELKADPRTADVPVLIISGLPETLTEERRAQATAVLTKPVDIATLLGAVQSACSGRHPGENGNGRNGNDGNGIESP